MVRIFGTRKVIAKSLLGCRPVEGLAGAAVEISGNSVKVITRVSGQVGAFGEVLAKQSIGVLVCAALPRAVRVAEVDWQTGVDSELNVLSHLGALVP